MSVGSRIRQVRTAYKLTLEKFGQRIGITRGSLSQMENDKINPSDQTIHSICREFGVNREWLRTGEGEMFIQASRDEELERAADRLLANETPEFRRRLVVGLSRLSDAQWDSLEEFLQGVLDERTAPIEERLSGGMTRTEYHELLDQQLDEEKAVEQRRIAETFPRKSGQSGRPDLYTHTSASASVGGVA